MAVGAAAAPPDRPLYVPGEAIVSFTRAADAGSMGALAVRAHSGASVAKTMASVGRPQTGLVRFPESVPVEEMVARLKALPGVAHAGPNYMAYVPEFGMPMAETETPGVFGVRGKDGHSTIDPKAAAMGRVRMIDPVKAQWLAGHNDPNSQAGWLWMDADIIWPDKAVNPNVAVIDTGVDYLHPDLAGRVVKGKDWVHADADPMDDNGHGTHCAGNVGAIINNAKGIAGISTAKIYAIKVLDVEGKGNYFDIASGILEAANNTAIKILSLSLGGSADDTTMRNAVQTAVDKGKLVVVAAGNDNTTTPSYPAYYASAFPAMAGSVMAVAAGGLRHYTSPGAWYWDYACKASYSNYGSWISVTAPGTAILSTAPTRPYWLSQQYGYDLNYISLNGTSMATPLVAGAAARAWSAMAVGTTAAQVKARLVGTGYPAVANGVGNFIDTNGDSVTDTECWTAATTTAATDVDVAAAMYRSQVTTGAYDADGRLPLMGGKVILAKSGVVKGYGGITGETAPWGVPEGTTVIKNLPMDPVTPYDMYVNKAGYTLGNQRLGQITLVDCGGGTSTVDCLRWTAPSVSVPKNVAGYWNVVTDWSSQLGNIDQYLFTPSASSVACSVGPYAMGPGASCGKGSLAQLPYLRLLHDGGFANSSGYPYYANSTFTTIKPPLASTATGTPYEIFLADYGTGSQMYSASNYTTTRVWNGGIIKGGVSAPYGDASTNGCTLGGFGATACPVFHVGDLLGTGTFVPQAIYGTGAVRAGGTPGVLPYSGRERVRALASSKEPTKSQPQ